MMRGGAPGGRRAGRACRGGGCLRLMPDQRASRFLNRNCDLDQHRARHGVGSRGRRGGITGPGSLASYGGCFTCSRLPGLLGSSRLRGLCWLQHKCHVGSDTRQGAGQNKERLQRASASVQYTEPLKERPWAWEAAGEGAGRHTDPGTPSDELLRSPAQAPGLPHRLCLLIPIPGRASASFFLAAQPHRLLTGGSHGEGPGRHRRGCLAAVRLTWVCLETQPHLSSGSKQSTLLAPTSS